MHFYQQREVSMKMQLESIIPVCFRTDSLVNAGTGSSKTICMVLAILLQSDATCLVVNPLRRLQINQFAAYGIRAQCINEDTPDDPELWKKIANGAFSVLVIAPELLDKFQGRMPRFTRLLKGAGNRLLMRRGLLINILGYYRHLEYSRCRLLRVLSQYSKLATALA
ncbi:hypothetical protein FA95DRAFT_1681728 [Auriscalpium vulgare]|uniref:Uncharacterized protein n=1 Tax=Auriscalpium vulgare TaxID=40419 RepID=A0ACB8RIQ9_9AGAM|nr:hypothetical protein FA95DRAFT_1681728 [Auriscalpium vulgare]